MKVFVSLSLCVWLIVVCGLVIVVEASDNKGGCQLLDSKGLLIDDNDYKFPLFGWSASDELKGDEEAFSIKSQIPLVNIVLTENDYFNILISDDKLELIVKVTQEFENYEQDQTDTKQNVLFDLNCGQSESSTISLDVEINDVNNHEPDFGTETTDVAPYMPLPPDYVILDIQVTDIDISEKSIYFTLDNNQLKIDAKVDACADCADKKIFKTQLKTQDWFQLSDQLTVTVTAKDERGKESSLTVNIVMDPGKAIPPSPVLKLSDITQLTPLNEETSVGAELFQVNIEKGFHESLAITLEINVGKDMLKYFNKNLDPSTKSVKVILKEKPDEELLKSVVILTLKIVRDSAESQAMATLVVEGSQSTPCDDNTPTDPTTACPTLPTNPPTDPPTDPTTKSTDPTTSSTTTSTTTTTTTTTTTPKPTDPTSPTVKPPEGQVDDDECDNTGLIAATVVLGITTACGIAASGYLWYSLKMRRNLLTKPSRLYEEIDSGSSTIEKPSESTSGNGSPDLSSSPRKESLPSTPPQHLASEQKQYLDNVSLSDSSTDYNKIESKINIENETNWQDPSTPTTIPEDDTTILEEITESPLERRKSVSFLPTVEQIEIERL